MSVISEQEKGLLRPCKIEIPKLFIYDVFVGGDTKY